MNRRIRSEWIDAVAVGLIRWAAHRASSHCLSERLEEEWRAHMLQRKGWSARLALAFGCCWAGALISRDASLAPVPQAVTAGGYSRTASFGREHVAVNPAAVLCEINTTPLIDVLLVLLVALIVSLPLMTHAVKLDLRQTAPAPQTTQPEVIDLDIDFDGTVAWNGKPLSGSLQLESYIRAAARHDPKPEIHLRVDRQVRYDFVAKVLASAQRNGLQRIGFVDTYRFKD